MENRKKAYVDYIKEAIISNKIHKVSSIDELTEIKSMVLLRNEYSDIQTLIKNGQIDSIKNLPDNNNKASEYLDVYTFIAQDGKKYIVTIYDSNELWQDSELWDIYELPK